MSFLTEQQLREHQPQATTWQRPRYRNILTEERGADITVFLSHSHHDRPLVEGLIAILDGIGIKIYVDWNDNSMPRVTNRETAEQIKGQIRQNTLFMILATERALGSKWVPWEVGIGDQVKGEEFILLIPVADPSGQFHGNEYLQLYNHLDFGTLQFGAPLRSRYRVITRSQQDKGSLLEFMQSVQGRRPFFS